MKILIDEQLPTKLKYILLNFEYQVATVRDMKWLGTKNGDLLKLMNADNCDLLLTNDKNLYYQQKISTLKVCILNINAKTNRYDDVLELIDRIEQKLKEVEAHLLKTSGGYFSV